MISVIGAGAFGTALAVALSRDGDPVTLWARDPDDVALMQDKRENGKRLAGVSLPASLHVTAQIEEAAQAQTMLIAVPMQALGDLLDTPAPFMGRTLVACSKGVDLRTGLGPADVIARKVPDALAAVLTGPSFAIDIASGLPTALTLACGDEPAGTEIQHDIATPNLRLYLSTDVAGAQLGGALKNVMALAAGIAIGAGLGESARASAITRGFAEMKRFADIRGARPETLNGLSGLGDLILTCTSEKSRNYRAGLALGRGEPVPGGTVEGVATAHAVTRLAAEAGIEMPLTAMVDALLNGETTLPRAVEGLLARPLIKE
ncbi:NAD(P)H-dependent glycerol-3-phosphate dehydrogenase [Tranquillimonas alkanivorans]|uniref:Glycerol-3-phosphate dehydrogenase [NAD(P)+] n=1 Tax=Tranquillimonas alkanivorans TaxID=441119 RepID=A0A1I5W9E0_9RHOB|nr:NAD(P)H-dependent glycerol-3-phosphate dehydrogenase [Tranquillimonas alkanivorans]SFQ15856.1 glycerol-3-phosphate dehydrogenase (NAD(P)+) [Tranquillimonas alkanivorans]